MLWTPSYGLPTWKPKKKDQHNWHRSSPRSLPPPLTRTPRCHCLQDYQPKQGTMTGKSLEVTMHLHCLYDFPKMGQFNDPWCTYCFYHNHENKNMLSRALFGNISPPWQKKIIKILLGRDMLVHSRVGPWNMSLVSQIVIHFHDCWKRSRWTWWYFTTEFWSGFLAPILIQVAFGVAVRCKVRKSFVKSVWKASENRFVDAL